MVRRVLSLLSPLIVVWQVLAGLDFRVQLAQADEPYGRHQFEDYERDHWAFVPVQRPIVPVVKQASAVQNPIDAFILAELEQAGIKPQGRADRRTLLRRVYLDLIGLPPTLQEQADFLADDASDAWTKVVDRLLARPEYGQRWGRHWLDVVRYAESNGYERDGSKPSVWRYRDYVIDAFNQDKPYDRFVIEQLAGDELPDRNVETQIATTFLRLGPWDDEPADRIVDRYDQLDDIVGATTATFMAMTVRCARCHDHKFEPIRQRDYARMTAVFEPLKRPQNGRTDLDRMIGTPAELASYEQANKKVEEQIAQLQQQIDQREWSWSQKLALRNKPQSLEAVDTSKEVASSTGTNSTTPEGSPATSSSTSSSSPVPANALQAFETEPGKRTNAQKDLVKKFRTKFRTMVKKQGSVDIAPESEQNELRQWEDQILDADTKRPASLTKAYIWHEESTQGPISHVFRRGNPRQPAEEVGPGVPGVLVNAPLASPSPTEQTTGRRLQLAQWLVQPDHPLTARVMVNRIWQHHFGEGLVATENDFGLMGAPPTHVGLLDWLAAEFVARSWSIKQMHRLMLLSGAYQRASGSDEQSAKINPSGDLLWRFPSRRLEAETIRDCTLAVSGQLNTTRGGPSMYPQISRAVMAGQSRPGNGWGKSSPTDVNRRSVYIFVKRTLVVPELEVLDFPDTNSPCEQRMVSTVAPQALTMLNGAFMREQAQQFAQRLSAEAADNTARIERAFMLALARPPKAAETRVVLDFLARQQRQIESDAEAARKSAPNAASQALEAFCLVLLNSNEFVYLP